MILNHHCTLCGSPTFDGMGHTCLTYPLTAYKPIIATITEVSTMKTQEPSMLIPMSLVLDLYAMAVIADNKEVLEGLKKAIKGEK